MEVRTIDLNFLGIKEAIASYIVVTEEGLLMVESGPHSTYAFLEQKLQKLGYSIKDVKKVLLTHIHLDHAGAAWALAEQGAEVYVHPFGYKHLADPSKLMASAARIYKDDMDRLWGKMKAIPEDILHAVDDGETVRFGGKSFKAHFTPGHAVHHIAWQVDNVLFTGDVAGVKIGKDGMVVPPCPPPDINVEDWRSSIEKVKGLDVDTLYLTHFGKVENKVEHLNHLEETLLSWADWMKPKFENSEEVSAIIPEFKAFVNQQLLDFGVAEQDLNKYEAANPSFMSVTGLLRYWKKKASH